MLPKSIQIKSECPCIPSGLGIFLWELNYEVGFWGALPRSISQWKRDPCSSTRRLPSTKTVLSVGHWAAPVMLLEVHSIAQWPHSNGNKGGAWNVLSAFTVPDLRCRVWGNCNVLVISPLLSCCVFVICIKHAKTCKTISMFLYRAVPAWVVSQFFLWVWTVWRVENSFQKNLRVSGENNYRHISNQHSQYHRAPHYHKHLWLLLFISNGFRFSHGSLRCVGQCWNIFGLDKCEDLLQSEKKKLLDLPIVKRSLFPGHPGFSVSDGQTICQHSLKANDH